MITTADNLEWNSGHNAAMYQRLLHNSMFNMIIQSIGNKYMKQIIKTEVQICL